MDQAMYGETFAFNCNHMAQRQLLRFLKTAKVYPSFGNTENKVHMLGLIDSFQ